MPPPPYIPYNVPPPPFISFQANCPAPPFISCIAPPPPLILISGDLSTPPYIPRPPYIGYKRVPCIGDVREMFTNNVVTKLKVKDLRSLVFSWNNYDCFWINE